MKDLIEAIYNVVTEWRDAGTSISELTKEDIKYHFRNFKEKSWGYSEIPNYLSSILYLLQYENSLRNPKNQDDV